MPSSAQADLCELALRQVPKYTGHTDGGFVEGTKVGSWPGVLSGVRATLQSLKTARYSANVGLLAQAPTHPVGQWQA